MEEFETEAVLSRDRAIVRLLQIKDLSTELLDWLELLTDEDFTAILEGSVCVPHEQYIKVERLLDIMATIQYVMRENEGNIVVG